MNQLFSFSFLILFTAPVFAMEQPPEPLITLEGLNHETHRMPRSHLEQSTILKQMLEETGSESFAIPIPLLPSFNVIKPYFELAFQESNQRVEQGQSKIRFIKNKLQNLSNEELLTVAQAFNYLNISSITDQAHKLLVKRYSTSQKLADLLKKDSKELQATPDCKKIIAQGMLTRKPEIRNYWLRKTYTPREIPTTSQQLHFPLACKRVHAINGTATQIATAFKNNSSIYLADPTSGHQTTLDGHELAVCSLDFSHDNSQLVSSSKDHTIRIWTLPEGILLKTIPTDSYSNVCFNHDSSLIASTDRTDVYFWDSKTGQPSGNSISFNALIEGVCFNHDSTQIAVATSGRGILVANRQTGTETRISVCPTSISGILASVAFNYDSSLLAVIDNHNGIFLYDTNTKTEVAHFPDSTQIPNNVFLGTALRFTGTAIVSALKNGKIAQFQVANPRLQKWFNSEVQPHQVALLAHIMDAQKAALSSYEYQNHIPLPDQIDFDARPQRATWGLDQLLAKYWHKLEWK